MTELIVVSSPRMRYMKWIGGGIFKTYLPAVSGSISGSMYILSIPYGAGYNYPMFDNTKRGQQFSFASPPSSTILSRVSIYMCRVGNPTGTAYVNLYSDNNGVPGSVIASIGSVDVSTIPTSFSYVTFTPASPPSINAGTKYWIVFEYTPPNSSNDINLWRRSSDVYADHLGARYSGGSWVTSQYDHVMDITLGNIPTPLIVNLDFQYFGVATRRLEAAVTQSSNVTLDSILVNGVNIGTSLAKITDIPQATSYTIQHNYSVPTTAGTWHNWSITSSIQRYLYYNKTSIMLDELNLSEAYIQKVTFLANGTTLIIDDNPDTMLTGNSGASVTFTEKLPFRKLEWVTGSGEVEIVGYE
ncbi:MAG: choice-of-anchor R domain-containing protein [Nitrososphaerota archaeon]